MTPRWTAAVELQHRTAEVIDALPLDESGDRRLAELVNEATTELHRAWRDSGARTDEWSAAYGLHRAAMFRRLRRTALHGAVETAERVAGDARRVWPMAVAGGAV